MRKLTLVLTCWTAAVVAWALVFGGGRVAPCLGLSGSVGQLDCVARWEAANRPPSPLVDPALPWLWLGLWLTGCSVVLAVARANRD
jgi:hypothetical protein